MLRTSWATSKSRRRALPCKNGLSLCAIHHRALIRISLASPPDYRSMFRASLLEDEDGPMLDLLKGFHDVPLHIPKRAADRPDRERLNTRFARFLDFAA